MTRYEPNIRRLLDAWQFWIGVAYFGLAAVVVALYFVAGTTSRAATKVAKEQAIHTAQVHAEASATFNACVASIPEITRISTHLRGVNQLAAAVLENAKLAAAATPRGDPSFDVREGNYLRLLAAATKISAVQNLPVPTLAACRDRRRAVIAEGGILK